ncbi:hypothetical protein [Halalkalibacterium halodurans]|uniref:hypothetical protein n=1 Tax=Halalkalibacterium halodurans TaxID=86665 RepID=UPI002AAA229E|nr:hypothetical protein [Halalkalibacterium halodurans]MDY7220810.1 hypothetical protein [Halalkalibacterium halodurans]MDY7240049.1 hypothetical protein [Halalkalibacterium halodurans]
MTLIHEQLSQKEMINKKQVATIREAINVRYQDSTPKEKARMVAKMIHELIEDALPNVSIESKRSVRKALINRKLSVNSLTISANDIFECVIEFATQEEVEQELVSWVKKEVQLDEDLVEEYMITLLTRTKKGESELAVSSDRFSHEMATEPAIQVDEASQWMPKKKQRSNRLYLVGTISILLLCLIGLPSILSDNVMENTSDYEVDKIVKSTVYETKVRMVNGLPTNLQYQPIDDVKLRGWLEERDSLLAEEPYFSTILEVADEFNIHPLLLFAITGQEQGFVPSSHTHADEMANNPFNVFHSWEDFNSTILESSQIAARTIVNLSKDRPEDVDPIQWINRKYAEDPNWWKGVSAIFNQLESAVQETEE